MNGRVGEITAGRDDVGLDAVALHLPENMPFDDWRRVGERLRDTQQSLMWWVGDWLRFGERKHGVTYADAAELTGYKEGSLRDAVWLSGQFDLSARIDKLTWHHHRHAASLPPAKRSEALQRAVDEHLSTRALKALVNDMKQAKAPAPQTDAAPHQPAPEPAQRGPEASNATEIAPAPEAAQLPEPAPDPYGYAKLTEWAWLDLANGLRADLDEVKAKLKKAERDNRRLKERLKEHTSDKDESIRRLNAKAKNAGDAKWNALEDRDAYHRQVHALKKELEKRDKRIAELEQMGGPL